MDLDNIVESVASSAGEPPSLPKLDKLPKAKRKRSLAACNDDTASETTSQSVSKYRKLISHIL